MRGKVMTDAGVGLRPTRATVGSAGFDLYCAIPVGDQIMIPSGEKAILPTGWALEIPPGHVGLLLPRSSFGVNYDAMLANTVGVIDPDYRGEILAILRNHGNETIFIPRGERVAQLIVVETAQEDSEIVEVSDLSDTERGTGGFGSTGR